MNDAGTESKFICTKIKFFEKVLSKQNFYLKNRKI